MNGRMLALIPAALAASVLGVACARHRAPETAPPLATATARHFPTDDSLTVRIRSLVERGLAKGAVLGVLEADGSRRIVWYGSAGSGARPLGARSIFEIGSITKLFTATLLADMVARGEVSLADPVAKYLPAGTRVPSRGEREITLGDLATHHSALPSIPSNIRPTDRANPAAGYTIEQLYAFLASHELRHDIGSRFEYSNLGFGLLGHALARTAGGTYAEVVRKRILEPLGMRTTGVTLQGDLAAWMTEGHDAQGSVVRRLDAPAAFAGAGALRSNAEDLLTFLADNVGPPKSRLQRAMRDAHVKRKDVNAQQGVGLGWQIRSVRDRNVLMHTGGSAGYRSFLAFDPDKKVGVVLLANSATDNGPLNQVGYDLVVPPPAVR